MTQLVTVLSTSNPTLVLCSADPRGITDSFILRLNKDKNEFLWDKTLHTPFQNPMELFTVCGHVMVIDMKGIIWSLDKKLTWKLCVYFNAHIDNGGDLTTVAACAATDTRALIAINNRYHLWSLRHNTSHSLPCIPDDDKIEDYFVFATPGRIHSVTLSEPGHRIRHHAITPPFTRWKRMTAPPVAPLFTGERGQTPDNKPVMWTNDPCKSRPMVYCPLNDEWRLLNVMPFCNEETMVAYVETRDDEPKPGPIDLVIEGGLPVDEQSINNATAVAAALHALGNPLELIETVLYHMRYVIS